MPIYAYKCESCGHRQDVLQKISDPLLTQCPACAASTFVKQVTAAGFQLKGSGWYVTDFRDGGGKKSSADADAAKPGDADASAKPEGSGQGSASDKGASSSSDPAAVATGSTSGSKSGESAGAASSAPAAAPSAPSAPSP